MRSPRSLLTFIGAAFVTPSEAAPTVQRRRRRRGFTLLDYGMWAVAAGVGTNILLASSGGADEKTFINNFVQDVRSLQGNVRTQLRASGYGTAAIADSDLIAQSLVPSGMVGSPTVIKNPWSATATAVDVAGAASGATFTITLTGIPQAACGRLLQSLTSTTGITQIAVNGGTALTALPVTTLTTVNSNCSSAASNSIVITSS